MEGRAHDLIWAFSEGIEENMENLSQNCQCPGQDLNHACQKH
jgi:hypothetical protein